MQLLKLEYGNEYREGRSGEEAAKSMQDVNPHLARRTPRDAIFALKQQFGNYIDGKEPFNCARVRTESLRQYWVRFLDEPDSDVLAVSSYT